jgi:hypothetical protein
MKNSNETSKINYAKLIHKDDWLAHPVFGDPSFDSCERYNNNPICRGVDGLEWPVNCFLLEDPVSKNWFAYVGHYPLNYAFGDGHKDSICTVFRSIDQGKNWEPLGPVFSQTPFFFDGDKEPVTGAPDVSVVYFDGKYHMTFDWLLEGTTWATSRSYKTGVGYAWADKPEGPFHQSPTPIIRGDLPAKNPVLGKYDRFYATTLIHRKDDWMILILMDSGKRYAWGLVAVIANKPEGPYGKPIPIFHVEDDRYQPPLMEYFPAFVHEGWVYSPSTSVALNRDFQMIQRVKIEEATNPEAWEMFQHGSVWHGNNLEHEADGMWGQTYSAFIDSKNQMQILFPSKDRKNFGTINMAKRSWDKPYHESGLNISGHQSHSLALLKKTYSNFSLECQIEYSGVCWVFWNNSAPLGPHAPQSNAFLHDLSWPNGILLQLEESNWQLQEIVEKNKVNILATGYLNKSSHLEIAIEQIISGDVKIMINKQMIWVGKILNINSGTIGMIVGKKSSLHIESFIIKGDLKPTTITYLHTEGLLGAGQGLIDWQEVKSDLFRYQIGAVCENQNGRIKWNFTGIGFVLWEPKGPEYGKMEVFLDGKSVGTVDLFSPTKIRSQPVLNIDTIKNGFHTVGLKSITGKLVVDSLDVITKHD